MSGPEIVPFTEDKAARLEALSAGKAIGPVEDTEWHVEIDNVALTFDGEDHARAYWEREGGSLLRVTTVAWVALAKPAPFEAQP